MPYLVQTRYGLTDWKDAALCRSRGMADMVYNTLVKEGYGVQIVYTVTGEIIR